ncbi:MAG: sulfite exporter TauE/SafE family protein [Desulfobacteraceae bacterium]|nr:sulfite exporter TauE/SafE family protein [Desulfobacteraceae bacterium]
MPDEAWLSFPVGIIIATVVSSVGIGGGILWMPFFLIILKMRPETAVLTSLMIQTAGMGSGSVAYLIKKRVDIPLATLWLVVTIPGIAIGAILVQTISSMHLELVLGAITLMTAFLFVSANQKYTDRGKDRVAVRTAAPYCWTVGFFAVGSGMLSVSIGEWLIPIMRGKMTMRMHVAVATSIFTIFGTCIVGVSTHLMLGGNPYVPAVLWGVPGVIIGGQIGPRIAEKINERWLKDIFIFMLTLIGIHLIYNSY